MYCYQKIDNDFFHAKVICVYEDIKYEHNNISFNNQKSLVSNHSVLVI